MSDKKRLQDKAAKKNAKAMREKRKNGSRGRFWVANVA